MQLVACSLSRHIVSLVVPLLREHADSGRIVLPRLRNPAGTVRHILYCRVLHSQAFPRARAFRVHARANGKSKAYACSQRFSFELLENN